MRRLPRAALALAASTAALPAQAHSFGKLYNLPVPLWLYAWGAAAALLLSFLLLAALVTRPADAQTSARRPLRTLNTAWLPLLRAFSLAGLLLSIASGLFGTADAYLNFNMTFFWIVFVLGFSYATALGGDWYALINPWLTLVALVQRIWRTAFVGRLPYPPHWSHWPALALYMAFIWVELFARTQPHSLALLLLAYSGITLVGAWIFGASAWFRYGEFFGVFLRLTAKMAPLALVAATADAPARWRWRLPFAGLLDTRASSLSELVFVLFMLSSTAFDGLHATQIWSRFFWLDVAGLLQPWVGDNIVTAYALLRPLHLIYESLALLLSPFLYLGVYLIFIETTRRITGGALSLGELAQRFAYSLLPIALVYNVTHYYTLILTQGTQIFRLLSDPFGWGWNLFGTARNLPSATIPDMGWVWHTQVGLILFGHIVSVYLAHREALRSFGSRRQAALSQLPMLVLMMAFTTAGLWILAQPITNGGPRG